MIFKLNLLHIVLVLGAMFAVHLALREIRGRSVRPWRLFALPATAVILAMILVLFQLAARQPSWWFGAVFAAGAAVGAVRGATMLLKVDQNLRLLRPTSRRALFWVTLAIPISIGVEIGGAMVGAEGGPAAPGRYHHNGVVRRPAGRPRRGASGPAAARPACRFPANFVTRRPSRISKKRGVPHAPPASCPKT